MSGFPIHDISGEKQQIELTSKGKLTDAAKRIKLQKAAKDFESLFVYQLLKTMRSSVNSMKSKEEDSGLGNDVMTSMADQAVAGKIAATDAFGMAKLLMKAFDRKIAASTQENTRGTNLEVTRGVGPLKLSRTGVTPEFLELNRDESLPGNSMTEPEHPESYRLQGASESLSEDAAPVQKRNGSDSGQGATNKGYIDISDKENSSRPESGELSISRRASREHLKNAAFVPTK